MLYELVTAAKVFPSDWAVKEFEAARRQISIPPSPRASTIFPDDDKARNEITEMIRSMLELEPRQRPSSEEMKNRFSSLAAPRGTVTIKTADGTTNTLAIRHSDRISDILSEA
jgi:hypothetical protein